MHVREAAEPSSVSNWLRFCGFGSRLSTASQKELREILYFPKFLVGKLLNDLQ